MDQFLNSVETSLKTQNWFGALVTSLILPDICGWADSPGSGSRSRYVAWYEKYMLEKYSVKFALKSVEHVFLSGNDCYALRCSLLHEGGDVIAHQKAQESLTKFHFVSPIPGVIVHKNQFNSSIQLQVDIFCQDICDSVRQWLADVKNDSDVQSRLGELLEIRSLRGGFPPLIRLS